MNKNSKQYNVFANNPPHLVKTIQLISVRNFEQCAYRVPGMMDDANTADANFCHTLL